jgi:hypothetical protein
MAALFQIVVLAVLALRERQFSQSSSGAEERLKVAPFSVAG